MSGERRVIRASEIGEYEYCSRAWWYRHVIKLNAPDSSEHRARLARGQDAHSEHGRSVARSGTLKVLGIALLLCGLAALSVVVWLGAFGR